MGTDSRARMPRETPPAGRALVLVAIKRADGSKVEALFSMKEESAQAIMDLTMMACADCLVSPFRGTE